MTKVLEVNGHGCFAAGLAKACDILGDDFGIYPLCRRASQQIRMLGCEEFEEASILATENLPRLIGKMSAWPTVVERIAGLESRIPTNAVFFGPTTLSMNLYLARGTHWNIS